MLLSIGSFIIIISILRKTVTFRRLTEDENKILQKSCGLGGLTRKDIINDFKKMNFKIAYGNDARVGDLPWALKIYYFSRNPQEQGSMCTGTIISPWHIITASHCLPFKQRGLSILGGTPCVYTKAIVNHRQVYCNATVPLKVISVKSYITPINAKGIDRGNRSQHFSDFAIFELYQPIDYDLNLRPICLPRYHDNINDELVIAYGFGNTDKTTNIDQKKVVMNTVLKWILLQKIDVPEYVCREALQIRTCGKYIDGYVPIHQQSICSGDSGGGIEKIVDNKHILFGVLSRAFTGYCEPDYGEILILTPSFASTLQPYSDFICKHTGICPNKYIHDNDDSINDAFYGPDYGPIEQKILDYTNNHSHCVINICIMSFFAFCMLLKLINNQ